MLRRSKSDLMVTEIDRGDERFQQCTDALTIGIGTLSARRADDFASVKGFTLIEVSSAILEKRSARRLIEACESIEEHMLGQRCSYSKGKNPRLNSFLSGGGEEITAFEQAHLFEHLLKMHLYKIRLSSVTSIESRTFNMKFDDKETPVILISNQFRPTEFRDLVQYIWYLLGRAIRRGTYPTTRELNASLYLRRKTLTDNDFARKVLDRLRVHVVWPSVR